MCAFCLGQAFKLVHFLTRHIITVNSTQNQEAEKLQLPTFHSVHSCDEFNNDVYVSQP